MEAPRMDGLGCLLACFVGGVSIVIGGMCFTIGVERGRLLGNHESNQKAVEAGAAEWVVEGGEVVGVKWRGK